MRLANSFKYVEKLEQMPEFNIHASEQSLALEFPEGWLEAHPLTARELAVEQNIFAKIGVELGVS